MAIELVEQGDTLDAGREKLNNSVRALDDRIEELEAALEDLDARVAEKVLAEGVVNDHAGLSAYPMGASVLAAIGGSDAGWPTSDNFNIVTLKTTPTKASQIACIGSGVRMFVRRWNNAASAWGTWSEVGV